MVIAAGFPIAKMFDDATLPTVVLLAKLKVLAIANDPLESVTTPAVVTAPGLEEFAIVKDDDEGLVFTVHVPL